MLNEIFRLQTWRANVIHLRVIIAVGSNDKMKATKVTRREGTGRNKKEYPLYLEVV